MKDGLIKSKLCLCVAAAIALVGCNSDSKQSANNSSNQQQSVEQVQSTAKVKLGVNFPNSEAGAAWVGDTTEIKVSFFNTEFIGNHAEAKQAVRASEQCMNLDGNITIGDREMSCDEFESVTTRGIWEQEISLTPDSPTAIAELSTGKYRIEAAFFNAESKLRETSVSYVTLGGGVHNIKLRGIEATWRLSEPVSLQLLNQETSVDWDIEQAGVQTAAEAMGINGKIKGVHLASALTYSQGILLDPGHGHSQLQESDLGALVGLAITADQWLVMEDLEEGVPEFDDYQLSSVYQPIFIVEGEEGEYQLPLHFSNYGEYYLSDGTDKEQKITTGLSYLAQEYGEQGNQQSLMFAGISNEIESLRSYVWPSEVGRDYPEDLISEDYSYLFLGLPENNAAPKPIEIVRQYDLPYWNGSEKTVADSMIVALIKHRNTSGYSWRDIFSELQNHQLEFQTGSRVVGSLIEVRGKAFYNLGEGNVDPVEITPFLDASLNVIAAREGLISQSADNCQTFPYSATYYSNEYRWDEVSKRWVAGEYNELLTLGDESIITQIMRAKESNRNNPEQLAELEAIEDQVMEKADFNKDGTAELFEQGVHVIGSPYCWLQTSPFRLSCEEFTVETLIQPIGQENETTICTQPVVLEASPLAVEFEQTP